MKRTRLVLVFLLLLPAFAMAQSAKDSWDNLKQLHAGQKVEVVDMKMKLVKGNFQSYSEEGISLQIKSGPLTIERRNVLRVSLREHSKRARNALIGAAIGAGAGAVVGLVAANRGVHETGEKYFVMGFSLPILGGAGAGIGAATSSYPTVYRAKR
jgi:hypothetical protein